MGSWGWLINSKRNGLRGEHFANKRENKRARASHLTRGNTRGNTRTLMFSRLLREKRDLRWQSRTNFITGLSEKTRATAAVDDVFVSICSHGSQRASTQQWRGGGGWSGECNPRCKVRCFLLSIGVLVAKDLLSCKLHRTVTR